MCELCIVGRDPHLAVLPPTLKSVRQLRDHVATRGIQHAHVKVITRDNCGSVTLQLGMKRMEVDMAYKVDKVTANVLQTFPPLTHVVVWNRDSNRSNNAR